MPPPISVLLHALKLDEGPSHFLAGNYHHVENLARALAERPEIALTILADDYSLEPLRGAGLTTRFLRAASAGKGALAADAEVRRAVSRERPHIYHRPTGQLPFGRLPCRTIAGIADLNFATQPTPPLKRLYKEISYRWTLFAADRLVCVSDYTRSAAAAHFRVPSDRMRVIHHGATCLPAASCDFAERVGRPFWLTFGQQPHKNVETCLRVLAHRLQSGAAEKLVVVGESEYLDRIVKPMVRRLDLENRVLFAGRVDGAALHGLYRAASGLLFLSRYEGFGLPVLEAMQAGCPVICSDACSLPEVAGDAALMTHPNDTPKILEHCAALAHEDVRRRMVEAGWKRARRFTWEEAARKTVSLYTELAGGEAAAISAPRFRPGLTDS